MMAPRKCHERHCLEISTAGAYFRVFGIARPCPVSNPMALLSLTGTAVRANDVVVVECNEQADVWQTHIRAIARRSIRVIGAPAVSVLTSQSAQPNPLENGEWRLQWLAMMT